MATYNTQKKTISNLYDINADTVTGTNASFSNETVNLSFCLPTLSAAPAAAQNGFMFFNTTDDKIYIFDGISFKSTAALT